MSTDHKQLRIRFVKMRSKSGRFSKIMAAVMAVTLAFMMMCVTIVMAATGEDGLEHWDKNEAYLIDGTSVSLSTDKENVPQWVYDNVTTDGNMELIMKRYELRMIDGWLIPMNLLEIKGNIGSITLASSAVERGKVTKQDKETNSYNQFFQQAEENDRFIQYTFIEYNNEGYGNVKNIMDKFIRANIQDNAGVVLGFTMSEDFKIKKAFVSFTVNDENDNIKTEYPCINIDYINFSDIGDFQNNMQEAYIKIWDYNFSVYEKDYENKSVDEIKISVIEASKERITLDIQCNLPDIERRDINIYNEYENLVFTPYEHDKLFGSISLTPKVEDIASEKWEQENITGNFLSGHKYRVTVCLIDSNNKTVYRWQEYATIK